MEQEKLTFKEQFVRDFRKLRWIIAGMSIQLVNQILHGYTDGTEWQGTTIWITGSLYFLLVLALVVESVNQSNGGIWNWQSCQKIALIVLGGVLSALFISWLGLPDLVMLGIPTLVAVVLFIYILKGKI